ncbi:MAG: hypothetical protein ACE5F1_02590 [Planctomycetota bacterium]
MPKNKDLKRLVRSRMRKTGESYTAARSRLIRSEACSESGADFAELAGMSDAAVEARTGRTWKQWVKTLDAVDAASLLHRDIARHLHEKHELSGWWAQTVTVGYERIRGLREKGQRRGGGYDVNKSRTFPVPVARLYAAFGARQRGRWLGDVSLTVRKATREKSMRMTWEDGTPVDAYFQAKGPAKSQVQLQHRELATKSLAEERREYWTERLAALARIFGGRS